MGRSGFTLEGYGDVGGIWVEDGYGLREGGGGIWERGGGGGTYGGYRREMEEGYEGNINVRTVYILIRSVVRPYATTTPANP